jgi:hypothetical protein
MVGVVGLENAVMHQRVALEWIRNGPDWPMHKKSVQKPFKNRTINSRCDDADGGPEEE